MLPQCAQEAQELFECIGTCGQRKFSSDGDRPASLLVSLRFGRERRSVEARSPEDYIAGLTLKANITDRQVVQEESPNTFLPLHQRSSLRRGMFQILDRQIVGLIITRLSSVQGIVEELEPWLKSGIAGMVSAIARA
jgi:hypothetical protein